MVKEKTGTYFVSQIVLNFCEEIVFLVINIFGGEFEAEGQEFANFLRSLEQFLKQNAFLTSAFLFTFSDLLGLNYYNKF